MNTDSGLTAFRYSKLMVEESAHSQEEVEINEEEDGVVEEQQEEQELEQEERPQDVIISDSEVEENEEEVSNDAIGKSEIALLATHLDPQELDVVVQQMNTDDAIFKIGSGIGALIKFIVDVPLIMSPMQVSVPMYESVKYLKRRIFRESLKKGVFSQIDKYQLVWVQSQGKQVELTEEGPHMFENFLSSFDFVIDNEYHLTTKVVIQASNDKKVQDSMIHESKARAAQGSFSHLKFSDDESIRKMQRIFQGEDVDGVHYQILPAPDSTQKSGVKRVHEEMKTPVTGSKRRAVKWTKERTDAMIKLLEQTYMNKNPWKDLMEKASKKYAGLFPLKDPHFEPKDRKLKTDIISFTNRDMHDKWNNIKRVFHDNGDPDYEKLSKTRTLSLDEEHIRIVSKIMREGNI